MVLETKVHHGKSGRALRLHPWPLHHRESRGLGSEVLWITYLNAYIYQLGSISKRFQNGATFWGPSDQTHECMMNISDLGPDIIQLSLLFMRVYICKVCACC